MRVGMTYKELEDFIDTAERMGYDTWWVTDFCDEAIDVAKELIALKKEQDDARTDR